MDISHALTLLVGLALGALIGAVVAWGRLVGRYAAPLAAATAQRDALEGRLDDALARDDADDEVTRLLTPLAGTLARVERQVAVLERDRVEQFGELGERLGEVTATTQRLHEQTASLAGSLNSSTTRGMWGESRLRRLLEVAGLLARCDFEEQVSATTAHGAQVRPDVVVRLPGEKCLVVDAKAPLTAFLSAQSAPDEAERSRLLAAHAGALRRHVDTLARKEYWTAFETTPELVVCFVPADATLAAALEADPALYDHALAGRVVLASPATLLALLRTVAYAWRQDALTEHARELLGLGQELYTRLGTLGGHVSKVGSSLRRSVEAYNAMVGTLESRVFVTARRMHDLGLAHEAPAAASPVDVAPRPLTAAELLDAVDDGPARRDAATLFDERSDAGRQTPQRDSA